MGIYEQVPVYWIAQYLGAFLGSAIVYGIFFNAIDLADPNFTAATKGIFASYPNGVVSPSTTTLAFDQVFTETWNEMMT